MDVKLYHGDNLDIFPLLEDESVDTVITDPPYGLEFMGKKWDRFSGGFSKDEDWAHGNLGGLPRQRRRNIKCPDCDKWIYDHPGRACKCGGVRRAQMQAFEEFNYKWAKEALRVAKPGAMLCAFGGTRTHHRLMCAIEDAGWEIRDVLMWLYGSGFPKSHDISKAIDKAAGAEREVVGEYRGVPGMTSEKGWNDGPWSRGEAGNITSPATDAAQLWDGYGTALKPAYEPIILAMKPLPGTFAQNALGYGVAGLWVDGCRVVTDWSTDPTRRGWQGGNSKAGYESIVPIVPGDGLSRGSHPHNGGRWPANLLLSHAPGCECVGVRKVQPLEGHRPNPVNVQSDGHIQFNEKPPGYQKVSYTDPDGTETVEAWNCVPECPVFLLDQNSGESGNGKYRAGTVHGHFPRHLYQGGPSLKTRPPNAPDNYGDTGGASRFFTRFHYSAKASRAERELGLLGHIPCLKCGELDSVTHLNVKAGKEEKCRRNGHPTVKPLDVCRWLCRLTKTPTGGVVLDPFMGSGRIPMAAILEGRDTIGIELERPSFEIAQAAVQWAQEQVPEMVQAEMVV